MTYIQRKSEYGLETVDQFSDYREARNMIKEYRMSDYSAEYYLSQRSCKNWK